MNRNHTRRPAMPGAHIVALLSFLLSAGCTGVEHTAVPSPPPINITPDEVVAAKPATRPAQPPENGPADQGPAKSDTSIAKRPAKAGPSPALASVQPPGNRTGAAANPGKPAAQAPLDLSLLEKRLRETDAIGVFTKIALKNQVDDLLSKFRAHYQGKTRTSLTELRQPYDMLLLKVLSLVQNNDPALARAIVTSREEIWGMLADPNKFATL